MDRDEFKEYKELRLKTFKDVEKDWLAFLLWLATSFSALASTATSVNTSTLCSITYKARLSTGILFIITAVVLSLYIQARALAVRRAWAEAQAGPRAWTDGGFLGFGGTTPLGVFTGPWRFGGWPQLIEPMYKREEKGQAFGLPGIAAVLLTLVYCLTPGLLFCCWPC